MAAKSRSHRPSRTKYVGITTGPDGNNSRSPNFTADANPGAASADGKKTVAWAYHGSLHDNLRPKRVGGPTAPAKVVVMAIPCISDNLPASLNTAATVTYDIAGGPTPRRQVRSLTGFDALRLARAACQANA